MNILEILKKCPIGTKLYSPICGECKLYNIHGNRSFDVLVDFTTFGFLYDGRYTFKGECCIFPSKDQRDWSKFQIPVYKNGDIVYHESSNGIRQIFIVKEQRTDNKVLCYLGTTCKGNLSILEIPITVTGYATPEDKEKLFELLENNGYKWNSQTKTLEKLIKDKFDISTLKPFDKVLVRNYDNEKWNIEFFARRNDEKRFETLIGIHNQCIPYEGNEYLLHKTDDCDNYYKIW